jgi:hypothetical protein
MASNLRIGGLASGMEIDSIIKGINGCRTQTG